MKRCAHVLGQKLEISCSASVVTVEKGETTRLDTLSLTQTNILKILQRHQDTPVLHTNMSCETLVRAAVK